MLGGYFCRNTNGQSDTARRSRGLYDGVSEYGDAYLWVYCNEASRWFKHCKEDTGAILAWEDEDIFFNNWYITICPAFYNPRWAVPFNTIIDRIRNGGDDPSIMESWEDSQAATIFHETMHMSQLVTSPEADDNAYGAEEVYDLARTHNTDGAVYNADSWTMAANAILAQQMFKLQDPPHPKNRAPKGATTGKTRDGPRLRTVVLKDTGIVPEGAGPREQGKPFNVDLSLWEVYDKSHGCKQPLPMTNCVNKNGKCYCAAAACMSGVDCYTVEATHCDAECKGCQYPMEGSC